MAAVRDRQRRNILDSATSQFLENGMFNTSMGDIAGRSGVTRRTLYRYFETREELAYEVLIGLMEEWNRIHMDIFGELEGSGLEKLEKLLYGLVNHMEKRMDFLTFAGEFDFYFKDDSDFKPKEDQARRYEETIHLSEKLISSVIEEGIRDLSIEVDRPVSLIVYTITNVLWSYGQRIAIRGEGIKEEFGIDPREMFLCQIDLYLKVLKRG